MTKEEIFKEWEKLTTHEKNEFNEMQLAYLRGRLITIKENANEKTKPVIDMAIGFGNLVTKFIKGSHNEKELEREN